MKKAISGFQTGTDLSAIITAKKFGFETSGWIPKGFRNLNGKNPEFKTLYNAQEHFSYEYPPRTHKNVQESDATIRIASNWRSAGELCTAKAVLKYSKPCLDIDVNSPISYAEAVEFIRKFETINFAGNSEKTSPGISQFVEKYLTEVFKLLLNQS